MEYQTIQENGKTKFIVLPIKLFEAIIDRLDDDSDLRSIREAKKEPLYNQDDAEELRKLQALRERMLGDTVTPGDVVEVDMSDYIAADEILSEEDQAAPEPTDEADSSNEPPPEASA